jgi:3-dehydroquinate synthase
MVEKQQWQTPLTSRVEVRHPLGSYDVVVGRGLLPRSAYVSGMSSRTAVVTDSNVAELYVKNLNDIDLLVEIVTPAGEEHKTLETVREIYNQLLEVGLDRRGTILALGGGVVGDMAGFAAATYMRGIRFIQCPTSLLAMVDASVGGKTGVDLPQGKNLVGAFKQPESVIADLDTLRTLPIVELRSGMAEVVKSGLIASRGLLDSVTALARSIGSIPGDNTTSLPIDDLHPLIVEAIMIKRDIVESDPFERDERRLLNLGHTFGHAIELTSGYAIRHGEAVAIGLVAASRLSSVLGYCGSELSEQIEGVLTDLRLPTRIPEFLEIDQIMLAMKTDKKSDSGSVHFILIRDVGDVFVKDAVPLPAVKQVLENLKTE